MQISLKDKTALVFGASKGIGKATAIQLAESGAHVLLAARNIKGLEQVQNQLSTDLGQQHASISVDLLDHSGLTSTLKKITDQYNIDILINNTGGPPAGPIQTAMPEQFLRAFNQHLIAAQIITSALLPNMKANKWGRIINVISTSVKAPLQGLGVSNTIRAAVGNWSKTLASEIASENITVNNILPGATNTDRLHEIIENKAQKTGLSVHEIEQQMQGEIPMGRFAEPRETASAICFLASAQASYITGTNLVVDGGRTPNL